MTAVLAMTCKHCGKQGLVISRAGIRYCPYCKLTTPYTKEEMKEKIRFREFLKILCKRIFK